MGLSITLHTDFLLSLSALPFVSFFLVQNGASIIKYNPPFPPSSPLHHFLPSHLPTLPNS